MPGRRLARSLLAAWLAAGLVAWVPAAAAESRPGLAPCRLEGLEHEALCGSVRRPLDPARPQGVQIDVHFAVLPALARNRKPDPVFFFAGGPGQSAIDLAGPISSMLSRLSNRRDIVLVDQRGTGRSAPLSCGEEPPTTPLAETIDPDALVARMHACRARLQKLPYGDLRLFTTWIASQDTDVVRRALGAAQVNLVGGSYGTRAALDYLRQYPQAVRRMVIDGVAPPDMVLPASFSRDNQAALDALLASYATDAHCRAQYPALRADWQTLLASLPRTVQVAQPVTGEIERLMLTREMVLGMVRAPLYAPWLAAGLPLALHRAAAGHFEALIGLASATSGGSGAKIYDGMHFSVVCAEDWPRSAQAADTPSADFGDTFARQYRQVCADWPRGEVPAAFYRLPVAHGASLLLSGGADPVTPPRHGERVARALGPKARHVVVPQAGHGVMGIACMRDVIFHFIDAAADDQALKVDAACVLAVPRPPAFVPVHAEGGR